MRANAAEHAPPLIRPPAILPTSVTDNKGWRRLQLAAAMAYAERKKGAPVMDSYTRFLNWLADRATLHVTLGGAAMPSPGHLDALFDRLRTVRGPGEARTVESAIWRIWMSSADTRVRNLMRRGLRAMAERRHDDALEAFDIMVAIAPDYPEGWNKRATVYFLLGDYDESVADIDRALGLEPRHFGALSGLAQIKLMLGRDAEALAAFEAAVALHPHLPGAGMRIRRLREKLKASVA